MLVLRSLLLIVLALPAAAASRYHLELEANPAAAFPYLGRFGAVHLHVYASGVRGEALWLYGVSKNDAPAVTVANPLARLFVDVPVAEIAPTIEKLAGAAGAIEHAAAPVSAAVLKGKVHGIDATRYRLVYGPTAYIDYWTTEAIPENPQLRTIADQLVSGISPGTAAMARTISGTPVYIELNFRRFQKVPLLKVKNLTFDVSAEEEKDALELGPIYLRAPLLDKLF